MVRLQTAFRIPALSSPINATNTIHSFDFSYSIQPDRPRYNLNPIATLIISTPIMYVHKTRITYPSGSKMNAMCLIFPSVGRFLNVTPISSKRAHALSTSSTAIAMCPKPRPGSLFPLAYPWKFASDSVPWLCVSSRSAVHRDQIE